MADSSPCKFKVECQLTFAGREHNKSVKDKVVEKSSSAAAPEVDDSPCTDQMELFSPVERKLARKQW